MASESANPWYLHEQKLWANYDLKEQCRQGMESEC